MGVRLFQVGQGWGAAGLRLLLLAGSRPLSGGPPPHPEELVALSLPSPWSGGWRPWRSSDPKPLAYILPSV